MSIQKEVYSILSSLEGDVGIFYHSIGDDSEFSINPNKRFSAASVIKIPLVSLVLKKSEEGAFSLQQEIEIHDENFVGGTGILRHLSRKYKPTIEELCKLAIIVSDNTATNTLIDIVGGCEAVTSFCQHLGFSDMKLQRKMLDLASLKAGRDNFITAGDIGKYLLKLKSGKIVSKDSDKILIDFMKAQQLRNKLPYLLPAIESYDNQVFLDEVPEGKVVVANKTGDLWTVQNDVGIFYLPGGKAYVLAICSSNLVKQSEGITIIGLLSEVFYRYAVK